MQDFLSTITEYTKIFSAVQVRPGLFYQEQEVDLILRMGFLNDECSIGQTFGIPFVSLVSLATLFDRPEKEMHK